MSSKSEFSFVVLFLETEGSEWLLYTTNLNLSKNELFKYYSYYMLKRRVFDGVTLPWLESWFNLGIELLGK